MSRLTNLTIRGLKSADRTVETGNLNLVLGPVGSGKSTVLDAVRFVALGYVPAIGKSEASTAAVMNGEEIFVQADTSDGRSFTRALRRETTRTGVAYRGIAAASWVSEAAKTTEHAAAIIQRFGSSDRDAAEHLDLRELLACTPNDRAKRIAALLDASGMSPDELVERARAIYGARLSQADPAEPHDVASGEFGAVHPHVRRVAPTAIASLCADLLALGLGEAALKANKCVLDWAASSRAKVAARNEVEAKLRALDVPNEKLADLKARRDSAIAGQAQALRDIDRERLAASERAKAQECLVAFRSILGDAKATHEEAIARLPRAEQARDEAKAIVDPDEIATPPMVEVDAARMAEAAELDAFADRTEEIASGIVMPEEISTLHAELELGHATTALRLAGESPWREVERIAHEIDDTTAIDKDRPTGPHGQLAAGEALPLAAHTDALRALAQKHGGDTGALKRAIDDAQGALDVLKVAAADRAAERTSASERAAVLRASAKDARVRAREIRTAEQAMVSFVNNEATRVCRAARQERLQIIAANQARRAALEQEAARLVHQATQAQEALDRAQAAVQAADAKLAGIAAVDVDIEAARRVVQEAGPAVAALDLKLAAVEASEALRRQMTELADEISRADAGTRAYKAAEWTCVELRKLDMESRSKGLEARMALFLAGAGRTEVPYLEAGKGFLDFGWRRGGKKIAVEALSGGESVLFIAALAAAVISLRNPPMKLLLIEAAELGSLGPAQAVLRGCEAMAGYLDQVFVATNAGIAVPDGWTAHVMGGVPAREEVAA